MSLGSRVEELRRNYDFSVEQAADLCRLSKARWSAIERGEGDDVSTWELQELSAALAVEPRSLLRGDLEISRRSVARFRAPAGIEEALPEDVRLLARAAHAARVMFELHRSLEFDDDRLSSSRRVLPVGTESPWKEGYALGAQARSALAIDDGPIDSVQRLLEGLGIHIAVVPFVQAGIEAVSLFEPKSAPVILLNERADRVVHRYARRAILAHELCHLLHDGGERDLDTVVSRSRDESAVEQRAGGFAPSFLAPGPQVNKSQGPLPEVIVDLGETWGLSFEGAVWHAKNLAIIDEATARHLLRRRPRPALSLALEPDPEPVSPEAHGITVQPSQLSDGLLARSALRAYEKGIISEGRAREIIVLR